MPGTTMSGVPTPSRAKRFLDVIPSGATDLDLGESIPPRPRSLASLGMTEYALGMTEYALRMTRLCVRRPRLEHSANLIPIHARGIVDVT